MFDIQAARSILGKVDDPLTLLEGLFVHSPIGVQLYSREGQSLFVNEAFMQIFHSAPPPEYSVLRDENAVRNGVDSIIREAFEGKVTKMPVHWYDPREVRHARTEGGRRVAIETVLVPIRDSALKVKYVVFFFRDVTQEFQLEQEKLEATRKLRDANALIDRLMNGMRAVVYAKDLEGRLLLVNDQYGRVVGKEPSSLIGKLVEEVHTPEIAAHFRSNDLKAMDGRPYLEVDESLQHPDGTWHDYISHKFPLFDGDGKIYGMCGISTDISNIKSLEKELSRARRMESLGLLAGGIAHDFNNLLGMILLSTESVSNRLSGTDSSALRDLEQIKQSVERASAMVRQLLAFGRRLPIRPQAVDLNKIVGDLSYLLAKFTGESTQFRSFPDARPCLVTADPNSVEQALVNLCLNSRQAVGQEGTIKVSTGLETVGGSRAGWVLECLAGEYALLEVADDGHGMTREVLERAFDPFFTTKDRTQGSGLGLSTVFGIMQESKGGLFVDTAPGKGCRIRLYFPVSSEAETSPGRPGASALSEASKGARARRNTTVLIVEDEELLRLITARQLDFEGFTVLEAQNGAEARALLKAHPEVALLVTDVMMPGQSGPALVKDLSSEGLLKGKGVLFITGYSSEELEGKGFRPDSMHLLEKPFTTQGLVEMAERCLQDPER